MTSPALAIAPESGTARSARVFTSKTLAQPKAGVVATDRTGPPARQISHPELEGPAEHVSADLPKPLISADVDVRGFPYTPIYRSRLFGSSFHAHASDAGWRAGFTLWLKSWDQCPSGSLPNDDIALCRLAELGRDVDTWRAIREEALHGWFLCADGRLYHPIVTEGIEEAWRSKCSRRQRTKAATAARMQKRSAERDVAHDEYVTSTNITEHNRPETEESPDWIFYAALAFAKCGQQLRKPPAGRLHYAGRVDYRRIQYSTACRIAADRSEVRSRAFH